MASFVVRRAVAEDLDEALDVFESVAAEGVHIGSELPLDRARRKEKWLSESIVASDGVMFVAEVDGSLVGLASLRGTGPSDLGMCIAAEHRGTGIGTALVEACIDWARSAGSHKITLQVWPHNEAALALYRKFGFEQEGYLKSQWRRRNGEIWDSIVMGLLLDDRP